MLASGVQYIVDLYLQASNSIFETEMMSHFSAMLRTEAQPIEVTSHSIATLVTERRRYKEVPLPLVDLKGELKAAIDVAEDEPVDAQTSIKQAFLSLNQETTSPAASTSHTIAKRTRN